MHYRCPLNRKREPFYNPDGSVGGRPEEREMRGVRRRLLPALATVLATCASEPAEEVDLLLHNGKVVTVDAEFSIRSAVAVRDGKIVAVGGDELCRRFHATQTIDLEGKVLLPGFNDTHIHISGEAPWSIDLTETKSIAELQDQVRAKVKQLGAGEWVTGYGWSEDAFAEGRRPLRADLDEAAPQSPVVLTRAGGHSAVANSMALELAGLSGNTPDPDGGVIEKGADGELNGVIRERQGIVTRLVPRASREDTRDSFVQNLRELLSVGITSIIQAGVTTRGYRAWGEVYEELGEGLPRANVQIRWGGPERMKSFGMKTGDGDERLRIGAVKVLVDGGFTGPAAYTIDPYKGQPDYRGKLNVSEDDLGTLITQAHQLGWQMGFHAIGDAAIQLTVDYFVAALEESPREDHRHYLNHFTVRPPAAVMQSMADHGILIAQQPNFTYTLEGRYVANLAEEHVRHNNPLRSPMDHGVFVALGSDILPIGPMVGIYAAVTRKGMSGAVHGAEERLTMEEAIRGYTAHGAFVTFEEDIKGTLEPGKLADMVVLSEDLLTIDHDRIRDVVIEKTILGGRVVFSR